MQAGMKVNGEMVEAEEVKDINKQDKAIKITYLHIYVTHRCYYIMYLVYHYVAYTKDTHLHTHLPPSPPILPPCTSHVPTACRHARANVQGTLVYIHAGVEWEREGE